MSWLKVSDGLWNHTKVAALDAEMLEAMGLWTIALSWIGEHLTDGIVPRRQLVRLAGSDVSHLAARLVAVGLWEEVAGGFLFHDYLEYNPARTTVLVTRAAAKARMRAIRSGEHVGEQDSEQEREQGHESLARVPSPVLPFSRIPDSRSPGRSPERRAAEIEVDRV